MDTFGYAGLERDHNAKKLADIMRSELIVLVTTLSLPIASGCWIDSGQDEQKCQDETQVLSRDEISVSKVSGEELAVETLVATVEGTWSGPLQWVQTGADATANLSINVIPDQQVRVYYSCGKFAGADVPSRLVFSTNDGLVSDSYTGNVSLDGDQHIMNTALRLPMDLDASLLASTAPALADSFDTSSRLWLTLVPGDTSNPPYAQATIRLEAPVTQSSDASTVQQVTLGHAEFTPTE